MKRLVNLQNIDFEEEGEDRIMHTRCAFCTPEGLKVNKLATDYRAPIFKQFFDCTKFNKVCEIGTGWGRNSLLWGKKEFNTEHIKYYGIDASPTSVKTFIENSIFKFDPEKQYVSNEIDNIILSQKYDFIFSTIVLNHIGFYKNVANEWHPQLGEDVHDSISIAKELWPTLNIGGFFCIWECQPGNGQNGWDHNKWINESFDSNKIKILYNNMEVLNDTDGNPILEPHFLVIIQKIAE